jgi:NADH dehydrogenase/NADH:ubiquinone oxidoreductase subunit G
MTSSPRPIIAPETERVLHFLKNRLSTFSQLETDFDLGNGLSETALTKDVIAFQEQLAQYTEMYKEMQSLKMAIKLRQKTLEDTANRLLMAIAAKYGIDSPHYKSVKAVRKNPFRVYKKIKETPPAIATGNA